MSTLADVLALAANNTAGDFSVSGNSLAVLFYALDFLQSLDNWRDYPDEILSSSDIDEIQALVDGAIDELMRPIMATPIGGMMQWGAAAAPSKWLLCNGALVSRATYADLFAVIGAAYGAGDGSTTFALPDFRSRSPYGVGSGSITALGQADGAEAVALSINNLPSHDHDYFDPGHTHRVPKQSATVNAAVNTATPAARTDNPATPHITTDTATTGITFHSQGSNIPHPNLHPVLGVHFIIYAGV